MKVVKGFVAMAVLFLVAGCADMGAYQGRASNDQGNYSMYGDHGPAFSSPPVRMAPNGDRVSQYPPYFHPEH